MFSIFDMNLCFHKIVLIDVVLRTLPQRQEGMIIESSFSPFWFQKVLVDEPLNEKQEKMVTKARNLLIEYRREISKLSIPILQKVRLSIIISIMLIVAKTTYTCRHVLKVSLIKTIKMMLHILLSGLSGSSDLIWWIWKWNTALGCTCIRDIAPFITVNELLF